MRTPAWLSPSHPIVNRELGQWRQHTRQLWLTFVLAPVTCTACLWIPFVTSEASSRPPGLFLTAWLWEVVLSLWLGFVATTRAISLVTREQETRNWPLLRLTPFDVGDILRAKIGAIFYWLRWPIALVAALRILALAVTFAASSAAPSARDVLLGSVLAPLFCAELVISVAYNCSVGLLASSLTRSTAAANAIVYLIHTALFVIVFGPLWYGWVSASAATFFLPVTYSFDLFEGAVASLYLLIGLMLTQMILGMLMSLVATSRVERLAD